MITLSLANGTTKQFEAGITGFQLTKDTDVPRPLKRPVAMLVDGNLCDLGDSLHADAAVELVDRFDPRCLELIRHDCAHVLAEAVQSLFPSTQVTIGPVIENGFFYDFARDKPFSVDDFAAIEAKMKDIVKAGAQFKKEIWSRDQAKTYFASKGEHYKVELVDAIPEDQSLKIYRQGDWLDLCRGPHMTNVGEVGTAFKLLKVAGAYWRGDSKNAMLTRIYGTAFATQEQLDEHLHNLEEAERRDHRRLGTEMDLFHFQHEAPGSVFWHPKGWTLFQTLVDYMRRRQLANGYKEVNSPDMMDRALWETSGHWEKYHENMFITQTEDERIFAFKPMNCPGHVQIFRNDLKSYRDLPYKMAEFGKVHRYEPSGALHGLMRVRSFTQDDAHIFVTEDQLRDSILEINELILSIYEDFGFPNIRIKFSDRPEKRIGADDVWDKYENALRGAIEASGKPWTLNSGEGAFYGPKLEYVLRDAIGRDWQCGTVQVDPNLPERFGVTYVGPDGNRHTPVMIHRAMFGSLERFTGILIEHLAGALPLWLAPVQVVVCTITQDADEYAQQVLEACKAAGLRVELDVRNEKISYKVRQHMLQKVPVVLVCGKSEAAEGKISVRRLGSQDQTVLPLSEALAIIADEATPPDVKRARG